MPELSIVIASVNGCEYLSDCLNALRNQRGNVSAEVIVVTSDPTVTHFVNDQYPGFRVIAFDQPRSVPQLRAAGIHAAQAGIIAITEDHCIPLPDWFEAIRRAHAENEEVAIGGVVDNGATARSIDWAVYLCEYVNFASPLQGGADLPGPNVSFKRSALTEVQALMTDEFWETAVQAELQRRGGSLKADPTIRVLHKMHFRFCSFLRERFHYGRAFAGTRNSSLNTGRRMAYVVLSPVLPVVMLWRIARRVFIRKIYRMQLIRSLPSILCFMVAGAFGECIGYALGPGESALWLR